MDTTTASPSPSLAPGEGVEWGRLPTSPGPATGWNPAPLDVPTLVSNNRSGRLHAATRICASRRSGASWLDLLASLSASTNAWKSKKSSCDRGLSVRSGRSRQRNMRTPRLSKTPPSVYACRPNSPALAPTSAPVSSRGGKNPGKADEAVTAIGTVARPMWIRSMRNVLSGCRCTISRPFRLNEHRQPSLRLVARRCNAGFSGSSNRLVSP